MLKILPVILLTHLLLGCGESEPLLPPNITAQHESYAAQSMGVTFPASTNFLLFHYIDSMDDAMWLKIELPASDLPAFIAQPVLANAEWSNQSRKVSDMPKVPEWTPSQVQHFRADQIKLPSAEYLNVMIDETDTDKTIIYLMWQQT